MKMREYIEIGYKVICESMFGDIEIEDIEMAECYEEDSRLREIDEEVKIVYFEDTQDYDE